eukprot:15456064-Alexandrium_andersonii.AAC.1
MSRDVLCPRVVFDAWLCFACNNHWGPGGPRPPLARGHQRGCKATSMAQGPEVQGGHQAVAEDIILRCSMQ